MWQTLLRIHTGETQIPYFTVMLESYLTQHHIFTTMLKEKKILHGDTAMGLSVFQNMAITLFWWDCVPVQKLVSKLNHHTRIWYTIMTILQAGPILPLNSTIFLPGVSDVCWIIGKKLEKLKDLIHVPSIGISHFKWDLYNLLKIFKRQLLTSAFQSCSLKLFHLHTFWAAH